MPPPTERVYYHVTFQTRQRRPVLYAEVEVYLLACLPDIARRGEFVIVEAGCALTHLHLLLEKAPWADLLRIIRLLQIETSAKVLQQFPDPAFDLNLPNIWDTGYHYVQHSEKTVEAAKQYIRSQKQHHDLK